MLGRRSSSGAGAGVALRSQQPQQQQQSEPVVLVYRGSSLAEYRPRSALTRTASSLSARNGAPVTGTTASSSSASMRATTTQAPRAASVASSSGASAGARAAVAPVIRASATSAASATVMRDMLSANATLRSTIASRGAQDSDSADTPDYRFRYKRFRPKAWQLESPEARGAHTLTLVGDQLVMYGGHMRVSQQPRYLDDVWCLDAAGSQWMRVSTLQAAVLAVMEMQAASGGGGGNTMSMSGTGSATAAAAAEQAAVTGSVPIAGGQRGFHAAVALQGKLVVMGGRGVNGCLPCAVHFLDCWSWTWSTLPVVGAVPAPRYQHSATLLNDGRVYMFGGQDGSSFFNDLYALDLERLTWQRVTATSGHAPPARASHTAQCMRNGLLVHGGFSSDAALGARYYGDVALFDPRNGRWETQQPGGTAPLRRAYHASACFDDDVMMVHAGHAGGTRILNDIAYLDMRASARWYCVDTARIVGAVPQTRYGHAMCAVGDKAAVFGGWEGVRPIAEPAVIASRQRRDGNETASLFTMSTGGTRDDDDAYYTT